MKMLMGGELRFSVRWRDKIITANDTQINECKIKNMERILKKILLQKLKEHDKVDYKSLNLDKRSYTSGYSNGFVQGFFLARKWIIGIGIILVISLIFNFIFRF